MDERGKPLTYKRTHIFAKEPFWRRPALRKHPDGMYEPLNPDMNELMACHDFYSISSDEMVERVIVCVTLNPSLFGLFVPPNEPAPKVIIRVTI